MTCRLLEDKPALPKSSSVPCLMRSVAMEELQRTHLSRTPTSGRPSQRSGLSRSPSTDRTLQRPSFGLPAVELLSGRALAEPLSNRSSSIPCFDTINPKNFLEVTPKVHLVGFNFILYFRRASKVFPRSVM